MLIKRHINICNNTGIRSPGYAVNIYLWGQSSYAEQIAYETIDLQDRDRLDIFPVNHYLLKSPNIAGNGPDLRPC